jgi:FlaA1/EpsC-like NDP-sugar epimerase
VRIMKLLDIAGVTAAFIGALDISSDSFSWTGLTEVLMIRIALSHVLLFTAYLAVCSTTFSICGLYDSYRLSHWPRRLREILAAIAVLTGILVPLRVFPALAFATNLFLVLFCFLSVFVLFLCRECVRLPLHFIRTRGRNLRNVVIIAEEPDATALAQRVGQDVGLGYRVLRTINAREMTEWPNHK